ncbi:guanine deaminase [Natronocella acetinitrilica]|uniref:Guanine deaminase n=1 Tax=Natronocella acetinitrilica TaxID=414046 RepID=A0AAE3KA05_9GAMM|nr:amidohydrolase family protein [Natronocella acetinitrilica]MCP1673520.1 guanine deaminase [Natronocella acetinitrilica]
MHAAQSVVIRGGRVMDIAHRGAPLLDILVLDGVIHEIGPPGLAAPAGVVEVDATDRLLIPGLVNGHTHAHGALGKGLVPDRSTLELFLTMVPALSGNRSLEDKYLTAQLAACEMVRKGCTTCMDLFAEFPLPTVEGVDAVARAYGDVGMRAVIAPMMADRTLYQALPGLMDALPEGLREEVAGLSMAPHEASLEASERILRDWSHDTSRIRPALAPTIPMHCSDAFLQGCDRLARDHGVSLQTHLAESKSQAIRGMERYGRTLTAHLEELGLLGPHLSAAHGVWLDDDDMARLAHHGSAVVHNPLSNLRLGSGLAPLRSMLDRGMTVGLGTDAANTSDTQNMFEVTRIASYLSRIQLPDHDRWLGSDEVLRLATEGSAQALGFGDSIGRLAVGAHADIVFLRLDHIDYWPLRDPVMQVVNTESGGAVDSVMVDGRLILDHGRFTTIDEARLRADVERAVERLDPASEGAMAFAHRVREFVGAFCVANTCSHYHVERRLDPHS